MKSKAVFLHTGYRTAGTWLWSCFRALDSVTAYYEPLHEMLATLNREALASSTSDSWRSGHPRMTRPYFSEYESLLQHPEGVRGYSEQFAMDRLDGWPEDAAALEAWLRSLIDAAGQQGRTPVFKFCRSLGRLPWLSRTFSDAVHIVVLKNPVAQWRSGWTLMAKHRNPHFVAAPFVVLSANRADPVVARTMEALKVRLPAVPDAGPHRRVEHDLAFFKRYVTEIEVADSYRAFIAHWLLTSRHAADNAHAIFDCDLAVESTVWLRDAETWIGRQTGLQPSFLTVSTPDAGRRNCGFSAAEGLRIHIDALLIARELACSGAASAGTLSLWCRKIASAIKAHAGVEVADSTCAHHPMGLADTRSAAALPCVDAILDRALQRLTELERPAITRVFTAVRRWSTGRSATARDSG